MIPGAASGDGSGADGAGGGDAARGRTLKSSAICAAADARTAGVAPAARRTAMSSALRRLAGRTWAESRAARGAIAAGRRRCSTQCPPTEVWFRWFMGPLSRIDQRTQGGEESSPEIRLI